MTFWQGLFAARSHLAFFAGLAVALAIAWEVQRRYPDAEDRPVRAASFAVSNTPALRETGRPLTPAQRKAAQSAWAYFTRNTRPSGLVDSVDGYPATTLWDAGSALMGIVAAGQLSLIGHDEELKRAGDLIDALAKAPLLEAGLPNRSYDTRTLKMVNYDGTDAPHGTGWSAIDIARIAFPLTVLAWSEPSLTPRIRALLGRWKLDEVAAGGELQGGDLTHGPLRRVQEGRLGYEQYAAASLELLGLDASRARQFAPHLAAVDASGVKAPADDRTPSAYGDTPNPVTSEPFVLMAIEHGALADVLPLAQSLFRAQERHAQETARLVAVSEDHIDRAPSFVYYSVTEGGHAWVAQAPDGADASAARTLSYKAALGWGTLFAGDYADKLLEAALEAPSETGWISGKYENGQPNTARTVNTNGIALEVLAYQVHGPWLRSALQ